MSNQFLNRLPHIDTFFLDVDGVLTDGSVLATDNGEQLRSFNIKDGYALQLAVKKGYRICIITGGKSPGVLKRLQGLGITDIFTSVANKIEKFQEYVQEHNIQLNNALYMGDDIPDYQIMQQVGIAACPADAVDDIKNICAYISPLPGGRGCVRDVIEKVMKMQGRWDLADKQNLVW